MSMFLLHLIIDIASAKLTVDDTGIYFIGIHNQEKTIITYFNFNDNSMQLVFQDSNLANNITSIKTTSPGTQPLPNGRNNKIYNLMFFTS